MANKIDKLNKRNIKRVPIHLPSSKNSSYPDKKLQNGEAAKTGRI